MTRQRQDTKSGKVSRETVYVITSLTSAQATPEDLARLVREHWGVEVHHRTRDVSFGEDHSTSRTTHGPVNLATLRAAIITAIEDAGYLYVPEGRRDHVSPIDALYLHGLSWRSAPMENGVAMFPQGGDRLRVVLSPSQGHGKFQDQRIRGRAALALHPQGTLGGLHG